VIRPDVGSVTYGEFYRADLSATHMSDNADTIAPFNPFQRKHLLTPKLFLDYLIYDFYGAGIFFGIEIAR
jgi:hypothetical protein